MTRKKDRDVKNIALFLMLLIVIYAVITTFLFLKGKNSLKSNTTLIIPSCEISHYSQGAKEMLLPAVLENNSGAYAKAYMYYTSGSGKVFINVEDTLYGGSTEHSIRKAIRVASMLSNISVDNKDFYVDVKSSALFLEGPSAGAAFTLLALALLENKSINRSVMITGTVDYDGSIGPSGKIEEKAKVAKEVGASLFLVPHYLSFDREIKNKKKCEEWGGKEYCEYELEVKYINISREANITVKEVSNIKDAEKYVLY